MKDSLAGLERSMLTCMQMSLEPLARNAPEGANLFWIIGTPSYGWRKRLFWRFERAEYNGDPPADLTLIVGWLHWRR